MRRARQRPVLALTLARLANAPGQAAIALGGVLASFSLMVAMAIMVSSFRVSVDDWLVQILPADLYVRSAAGGKTAALGPQQQAALAAVPGVARVQFLRSRPVSLDPARPAVALIARELDVADPGRVMMLVGAAASPAGAMPAWVSKRCSTCAASGWAAGSRAAGRRAARIFHRRRAARLLQPDRRSDPPADYRALTGERDVNDARCGCNRRQRRRTRTAPARAAVRRGACGMPNLARSAR
jgi:putative ABC transport system permease protein